MQENLIVTWLSPRTYACPPLYVSPGEITHSSTREFCRLIYSQPLCSQHILLLVFLLVFFFSLLLIFTLRAASMSHFLTSAWNLLCTSSPLFFISRSSSFSIIPRQCRKLVKKKNTGYDILRIKLVNRKFYVVVVQQQRQRKKVHCACKVFFFLLNRPVNFCRARHRCRFSLAQITSTVYEDIS